MSARLLSTVLALTAATSLAACGSSGGGSVSGSLSPSDHPSTASSTPAATSSAPSDAGAATSAASASSSATTVQTPVVVNKTITDSVLGNKAVVLSYVEGYQPSAAAKQQFSALADETVVLVKVTVTAGTKYYGSFGSDDFRLTGTSNGIDDTTTTILDSELTKAGYPPLQDADTGKTTTGWLVFTPDKGLTKLILRVVRLAYNTSGGGSIPAKNFDLPLN